MTDEIAKVACPQFPRHVSSGEERHDLAVSWAKEEATRDALALEKEYGSLPSKRDRELLTFGNLQLIKHAWAEQRIGELERRLEAQGRKIKLLSQRLKEVSDVD